MVIEVSPEALRKIRWNAEGLIAAIVQDSSTKDVLMMAWMTPEALNQTVQLQETVFWSRSRATLWHKGETSGNVQHVVDIRIDCDADALLILVEPAGPACHTENQTCFFRTLDAFTDDPQQL